MKVGNVKRLDMKFYNSLSSVVSKRMYRYLDKRRYRAKVFDVELTTLATVNVGLDLGVRRYPSQIKQLVDPAHRELQEKGFLGSWKHRWSPDRKCWFVQYSFAAAIAEEAVEKKEETMTPNQAALIRCGLGLRLAAKLDRLYADRIPSKIDLFEFLQQTKSPLIARNPAGWLRKAIEDDYQAVPGYQTPEERWEKDQQKQERLKANERIQEQEQSISDSYWQRYLELPSETREEFKVQAISQLRLLPEAKRKSLTDSDPLLRGILVSLVKELESNVHYRLMT
jgi:hypothetical protein